MTKVAAVFGGGKVRCVRMGEGVGVGDPVVVVGGGVGIPECRRRGIRRWQKPPPGGEGPVGRPGRSTPGPSPHACNWRGPEAAGGRGGGRRRSCYKERNLWEASFESGQVNQLHRLICRMFGGLIWIRSDLNLQACPWHGPEATGGVFGTRRHSC